MPPKDDAFRQLVETMSRLRRDCPWDRAQTPQSILPYLIEEAYEVLEAVESADPGELRGELGDLLLQVLFHSELASERGDFDVYDVCDAVREKMIRRHPHVFGNVRVGDADEVLRNWARIKAAERREPPGVTRSVLDGVPIAMPALLRAERTGEKASRVGFDWPDPAAVLEKVREEIAEIEDALAQGDPDAVRRELGDCLFALASLGRLAGTSAEIALRDALERFRTRFAWIERRLREEGRDIHSVPPTELEDLWTDAKKMG